MISFTVFREKFSDTDLASEEFLHLRINQKRPVDFE
jgi:hypothetical protein